MHQSIALVAALAAFARSQQVGTLQAETHPTMTWQKCTAKNSCTTVTGKVVVDANWRWLHNVGGSTNCYTGNTWNAALCPDDVTCATNCALEGADYAATYGATTSGSSLKLNFVTVGSAATNIGSRLFLMDTDTSYQQFNLLNQEFTFDVDVSNLPCGLNGALYLVSMDKDGGMARYPANKAGAKYGVGYCDSQCPRDLKFINGQANVEGWVPSSNDPNAGVGNHGSCCAEMDIWEANSVSAAFTPHSCNTVTQTECTGDACGGTYSSTRYAGTCDPDGCDFNSYRQGNTTFYGSGKTVDTSKVFTVVTQFIGSPLTEIRRFYVQNGKLIPNSQSTITGVKGNSITASYCDAQKTAFGDTNSFDTHGGMTSMSNALAGGMTLVMSLWDDHYADMLWLDSTYPTTKTTAGGPRGTCSTSSGVPADVEKNSPGASVIYSNIKTGPINSTYTAT
ncbi:glucanase-3 [Coleophoma crateriformis]|uniref:Glucanase n=1 Tax=Coleophoma crateriformis TaxID=565419 RepID=A0A3D8QHY8_9HELO|nr:glucanase-3 [Coleophoma crateriformis]